MYTPAEPWRKINSECKKSRFTCASSPECAPPLYMTEISKACLISLPTFHPPKQIGTVQGSVFFLPPSSSSPSCSPSRNLVGVLMMKRCLLFNSPALRISQLLPFTVSSFFFVLFFLVILPLLSQSEVSGVKGAKAESSTSAGPSTIRLVIVVLLVPNVHQLGCWLIFSDLELV